jgi:hypothetical protein
MNPIWSGIAALVVACIYYIFRAYCQVQERKQRLLRERVAFMLWVVADAVESNKPLSVHCRGV